MSALVSLSRGSLSGRLSLGWWGWLRVWLVSLVVGVVVVGFGVGSAWATTGHALMGSFGGSGVADGQFLNGLWGVGVLVSSGQVLALSGESGRVHLFSAVGVFESSFAADTSYNPVGAMAVDPTGSGAVYVVGFRPDVGVAVLKYGTDGVFAYPLDTAGAGLSVGLRNISGPMALAVDQADGTVYVAGTDSVGAQVIARFNGATGTFIDSFDGLSGSPDGSGFSCPSGLAIDSLHRAYVVESCKGDVDPQTGAPKGRVDRYTAAGAFDVTVDDGSRGLPSRVAINPVSDEVYVSSAGPVGSQVTHYTTGGGAPVYTFDASSVSDVRSMTVSGDGTVYVADGSDSVVDRFAQFEGPAVTTSDPGLSAVGARSARFEGTINPEGVESSYHFEYGTDETYGSRTPSVSAGSGSSPVAALAEVTGLDPNVIYQYRLVGSNGSGSIAGANKELRTLTAPPSVVTSTASAIDPRSAIIHGTINPNRGAFANYAFEYGTTTSYGNTTSLSFLCFGCGGVDQAVAAQLSGLEPGTTYHYRVLSTGDHPDGTQYGNDQTFTTAPAAAAGATGITTQRATLRGTIDPHGVATTYHFNYGPTTSYGTTTPEIDAGSGDGERSVSQLVTGLKPDTTYHVQVVTTSSNGTVRSGADGLFRTTPAPAATVISPTSITTDTATLAGEVDTHSQPGSYHFTVDSLDSSYSYTTPEQPALGGSAAQRVTAGVSGLPAGETFVVELTVASNESLGVSDQVTFATAPPPRIFPTVPTKDITGTYGCVTPILDAYNKRPRPGEAITITGRDLGAGGNVVLGERTFAPTDWTTSRFTLQLPEEAKGTLALTVNCGHRSNTIAITIYRQPSNAFSISRRSVSGRTATLTVKVPGPGKLQSTATNTTTNTTTIKKAGTATLKIKLNRAGVRALRRAKSHRLKVNARVQFTPAGGQPATKTVTVTYNTGR